LLGGLRNNFIAGLVVIAPIGLTVWLIWTVVGWVDGFVLPFVPDTYHPETLINWLLGRPRFIGPGIDNPDWINVNIRGLGVVFFLLFTVIVGWIAKGLIGRSFLRWGEQLVGRMPARDPDHETRGRRPHFGYLPQNRWQGYRPYDENPEWIDPSGGIVGNTNNEVVDLPFPNHVSFNWGDTQRVIRWRLLMQAREVHTRDSFMDAQLDTVSYTARSLLALVAADLFFTSEPAPEGTPERLRQRALALLSDWNGEMNEHLPEPLIYAAWMRELQDRLIRDELGPLADEFTHLDPIFVERVFRDVNGASAWCDVIQSAPVETCTDIARQALDQALIWIVEHHGRDIESLRWGDAHEAVHEHEVLGQHWAMAWIANIYQSTSGGDNTLMRGLTSGTGDTPFRNVHAAGYRGVYDFADPDSSVFIISTGQSGHLLSRYYDNLGGLWRRGEYIPMSLDPALARGGAVGITVLRPE